MKENHERHEVHLSTEVYETLVRLARVGAATQNRTTSKLERHARKFNSVLRGWRKAEVQAGATIHKENREAVKRWLREYAGKEIFCLVAEGVMAPCKLLSRGGQGVASVAVRMTRNNQCVVAHVNDLRKEVPNDYRCNYDATAYPGCFFSPEKAEVYRRHYTVKLDTRLPVGMLGRLQ
jgi:hypothetical protein